MSPEIVSIPLDRIIVGKRLRAVDPNSVLLIAASFLETGQHTPIDVGPAGPDGRHPLIAGGHRVAAAREAGLDALQARIFQGDALQAQLLEIDENLMRRGLNEMDRAVFLARRKEIYEALNPQTQHGKNEKRQNVVSGMPAFTEEVAGRLGLSRRQIERSVARARIEPELREQLALTRWADHGATLDALAKAPPLVRARLVTALTRADQPARNITAALAECQPGLNPTRSADDEHLARLQAAWRKAPKKVRDQFLGFILSSDGLTRVLATEILEAAEDDEGRVLAALGRGRAA